MTVRLTEGDKTVTGGNAIEVTSNKVINLLLREEDNLLKVDDNYLYADLQLENGLSSTDELPVGVTTGRVLQADGWIQTGTLLVFKTTSGDYVEWIYGDDGKLYVDNGTGTFKQVYLKSEVDALFSQLRSELSDVAFSGDYSDLDNLPTLGTAASKDAGTNAGNVPVLDENGKLDSSIVPSTGVMSTFTVNTSDELVTLSSAHKGDLGIATDENQTFILSAEPYSVLANWTVLQFPTGAVSSVNGKNGAVTLKTGDISESNGKLYTSATEKASWNGKLGNNDVATVAITGSYNDLSNKPTIPSGQIQSDWNQNNESEVDYIKNKPVIDSQLNSSSTNAVTNQAIANEFTEVEGDIEDIQGDVSDLQTTVSSHSSSISELQTKVEGGISDAAFSSAWDGDTTHAPSKNAVYDVLGNVETLLANL